MSARANASGRPRMYDDLAAWWPLLSPPGDYEEEIEDLVARLGSQLPAAGATLLELGSGGGSFASHLKRRFRVTLTDISPAMLAVSRARQPRMRAHAGRHARACASTAGSTWS